MAPLAPTPDQVARDALAVAQAHCLRNDVELLADLNALETRANHEYQLMFHLILGLGYAFLAFGVFFIVGFGNWWLGLAAALLVVIYGSSVLWKQQRSFRQHYRELREALASKHYDHPSMREAFRDPLSDFLVPLPKDDFTWAWVSAEVAHHPALAQVWGQWLASDAPIRQRDVRVIQRALQAQRDTAAWRERLLADDTQAGAKSDALGTLLRKPSSAKREAPATRRTWTAPLKARLRDVAAANRAATARNP